MRAPLPLFWHSQCNPNKPTFLSHPSHHKMFLSRDRYYHFRRFRVFQRRSVEALTRMDFGRLSKRMLLPPTLPIDIRPLRGLHSTKSGLWKSCDSPTTRRAGNMDLSKPPAPSVTPAPTKTHQKVDLKSSAVTHNTVATSSQPGVSCYRCDRPFSKTSAMISHLESGSCSYGPSTFDLYYVVASHQSWGNFIEPTARYQMFNYWPVHSYAPFFCPCCGRDCARLAGLISHIEGNTCTQDLYSEPVSNLLGWIRNNI